MAEKETSPGWPFKRDTGGTWPMSDDDVLQAELIKQALLVPLGSRPMLKDLGAGIDSLVFSIDEPSRTAFATDTIKRTLEESVPRVNVDTVELEERDEGAELNIRITYRTTESDVQRHLEFPFRREQ